MNTMITCRALCCLIASAIFGAVAFSFTSVSAAADDIIVQSATVKFGDLDLSSSRGAAALYRRIRRAAVNVCWRATGDDYAVATANYACIHSAVVDAVTKINKPALFDAYNAHNTPPLPSTLTAEQGH